MCGGVSDKGQLAAGLLTYAISGTGMMSEVHGAFQKDRLLYSLK